MEKVFELTARIYLIQTKTYIISLGKLINHIAVRHKTGRAAALTAPTIKAAFHYGNPAM